VKLMRMNAGVSYLRPTDNRCFFTGQRKANCEPTGMALVDAELTSAQLIFILLKDHGKRGP